ncbi:MAG: polynucleotide adenylyltransferase PcnB, partial [Rhizobiales bacterium]|nr:polynucleotide adenylyltransferase PcnB [Rhizobacter sp.]
MIKKFIDKLLGKAPKAAAEKDDGAAPAGKRVEVPKSEHGIDPSLVDERAVKVVSTLADAGYEAYIVGGAVRDLLVGMRPKDFDVATNATPEQVKACFRRAFIIGRRFRIVHVVFGRGRQDRGLSEVIEVSTFRAMVDAAAVEQVTGNEKTSRSDLAGRLANSGHVVDAEGRVLRDNVWGPQIDDAARRDFTINAMYYDPVREIVVDYHGGIKDVQKKLLRMIGDPAARYREDPVRIIRVVRFAAKLGFEIEPKTRAPIREMAALLDNVPASRTFDEMIKLLQTGHALASIEELRKQGLHRGVFPVLDVALDEAHRHDGREKFVQLALADTDRRVKEGKSVAPSFMLACMLWHDVLDGWQKLKAKGEPAFPALQQAVDTVFDARIGDISGRGKLAADMREIWLMQTRFERRQGASVATLIEQPRFRAGFDFLRLRGDAGEIDAELANWWEDFSLADDAGRRALLDAARSQEPVRRVRSAPRAAAVPGDDLEEPLEATSA